MRTIAALGAVCALLAGEAPGQGLQASAGVDSTRYLVGDWISVRVRFLHPAGTALQPAFSDTIGPFSVVNVGALEHLSPTESRAVLTVARYDSGTAPIPPLRFLARVPGDSTPVPLQTDPVAVEVHTVPVDTAAEIRDIKPLMGLPWALWEIAALAGFLAALALTVVNAVRAWKDRKRPVPAAAAAPPPPSKPAHVVALERLGRLKEKKLWEQGLVKPYYSETTEIVREYIENRFRTRALEQTTDEIVDSLRIFALPAETAGELERMLRLADLVKFAKHEPAIPEHQELMQSARRFVERTRQAAPPGPPAAQEQARTHVGS